mgnify:CR=1 FL=1
MNTELRTLLSVENIRLKANHGWYSEERSLGSYYKLSVHMRSTVSSDEDFDGLSSTVNYELIYHKVLDVMKQQHKLIEHCAKAIFDKVKELAPENDWRVELEKENPPMKHVGATRFVISG